MPEATCALASIQLCGRAMLAAQPREIRRDVLGQVTQITQGARLGTVHTWPPRASKGNATPPNRQPSSGRPATTLGPKAHTPM